MSVFDKVPVEITLNSYPEFVLKDLQTYLHDLKSAIAPSEMFSKFNIEYQNSSSDEVLFTTFEKLAVQESVAIFLGDSIDLSIKRWVLMVKLILMSAF